MSITTSLYQWCGPTVEHLWSILTTLSGHLDLLCASSLLVVILCAVCACVINARRRVTSGDTTGSGNDTVVPESVNYHLTRQCNYKCGFCFHTAKTSFVLELEDAKRGLKLLKDAGE